MSLTLKEALKITRKRKSDRMPLEFSMEFISFDSNKSRGKQLSELKKVSKAVKVKSSHDTRANGTLSFKDLDSGDIGTVHCKNIMKINGQWVN